MILVSFPNSNGEERPSHCLRVVLRVLSNTYPINPSKNLHKVHIKYSCAPFFCFSVVVIMCVSIVSLFLWLRAFSAAMHVLCVFQLFPFFVVTCVFSCQAFFLYTFFCVLSYLLVLLSHLFCLISYVFFLSSSFFCLISYLLFLLMCVFFLLPYSFLCFLSYCVCRLSVFFFLLSRAFKIGSVYFQCHMLPVVIPKP